MFTRTWRRSSAGPPSAVRALRSRLRVGIPRVLNVWSTHQFWFGFFVALGLEPASILFSSDTSEEQGRRFGKGRGTVDCCYPVKALAGHYGELLASPKGLDILFSPMIGSVPSFLRGHVVDSLSCPRVMAAPESARAGFVRERDLFAEHGIRYVSPYVALADEAVVPRQLFEALKEALPGLTLDETRAAVGAGYEALADIDRRLRARSREILEACARDDSPCLLVLARPYHMDSGIGHEIDADLQARGYPVLWCQYLPTDADLLGWLFDDELRSGDLRSPLDIGDVWPSSYSANTNEILWAAKVAARLPWVTCVIRLSSYECGMDQPTYSPVQQIVEQSGTLFFSFQDLDATRPSGSVRIRIETIAYYLERHSPAILRGKRARLGGACPMGPHRTGAHV